MSATTATIIRSRDAITHQPTAIAIGMFDGVHTGHKAVIQRALDAARTNHWRAAVLTFANHPQTLLSKTPPRLLSSFEERANYLSELGIDTIIALPFDEKMQCLGAQTFVNNLLNEEIGARHIAVGYDFCFGQNREGNGDTLKLLAKAHQANVTIVEPVKVDGQIVSSTVIRKLLNFGDVQDAHQLLGRPYELTAPVVKGHQRGRQLGFPTANLDMTSLTGRVIPGTGTYAGRATLNNKRYPAVCNIGISPTFNDGHVVERVEIHLLDFSQPVDFYGQPLSFAFTHRLRDEHTFDSKDALIKQITTDCQQARILLQAATV